MARPSSSVPDFRQQMVEAYAVNDRMYQLILEHLDPHAWNAPPPGKRTRSIAAIVAHVHNIRCKWLRLSAPQIKTPAQLDRLRCTQKHAASAMAASAARCCEMLSEALNADDHRIDMFLRDGWARPWAPGAAMFAYMLSHEAHHRGQICLIAHQLGYQLPFAAGPGIWSWEKLWKACGFQLPAATATAGKKKMSVSRVRQGPPE